jgi:exodeoxyribonuclease VII large subunit
MARRMMLCWQRGQERRRTELRGAVRALPSGGELLAIPRQRLDGADAALPRALRANTHAHHRRFAQASAGLTLRVLRAQVAHAAQRLHVSGERLKHCARATLRHRRDRFDALAARLQASKLANLQAQRTRLAREQERTQRLAERCRRALTILIQRHQARVTHAGQLLGALSYRGVLARGFALVRDEQGAALHAAASVAGGAHLTLEFADGRIGATADADGQPAQASSKATISTRSDAKLAKPAAPGRRVVKPADQGSLF